MRCVFCSFYFPLRAYVIVRKIVVSWFIYVILLFMHMKIINLKIFRNVINSIWKWKTDREYFVHRCILLCSFWHIYFICLLAHSNGIVKTASSDEKNHKHQTMPIDYTVGKYLLRRQWRDSLCCFRNERLDWIENRCYL